MLTTEQYTELMENKRELQLQIDQAEADDAYHDNLKKAAKARKDQLMLRMSLYSGALKVEIDEYEAAHPPEPPA